MSSAGIGEVPKWLRVSSFLAFIEALSFDCNRKSYRIVFGYSFFCLLLKSGYNFLNLGGDGCLFIDRLRACGLLLGYLLTYYQGKRVRGIPNLVTRSCSLQTVHRYAGPAGHADA